LVVQIWNFWFVSGEDNNSSILLMDLHRGLPMLTSINCGRSQVTVPREGRQEKLSNLVLMSISYRQNRGISLLSSSCQQLKLLQRVTQKSSLKTSHYSSCRIATRNKTYATSLQSSYQLELFARNERHCIVIHFTHPRFDIRKPVKLVHFSTFPTLAGSPEAVRVSLELLGHYLVYFRELVRSTIAHGVCR
jgi:hypothetical protein